MRAKFIDMIRLSPDADLRKKLLETFSPDNKIDAYIDLQGIFRHFGAETTFWAIQAVPYKDYCLMLADIAESVIHIFEEFNPGESAPREGISAIRKYKQGEITKFDLYLAAEKADKAFLKVNWETYTKKSSTLDDFSKAGRCVSRFIYAESHPFLIESGLRDTLVAAFIYEDQKRKNEEILIRYLL